MFHENVKIKYLLEKKREFFQNHKNEANCNIYIEIKDIFK